MDCDVSPDSLLGFHFSELVVHMASQSSTLSGRPHPRPPELNVMAQLLSHWLFQKAKILKERELLLSCGWPLSVLVDQP